MRFVARFPDDLILNTPLSQMLESQKPTQRMLPSSVCDLMLRSLTMVWKASERPDIQPQQRRVCLLVLVMSHWLLWPEPPKEDGQRLAPHSRPRVIKAKHALLMSGQWHALFQDLLPSTPCAPLDVPMGRATPPGLLTEGRAQKLRSAAAFARPSKAWRQLWGWGAPPPSLAVVCVADLLSEKLQLHCDDIPAFPAIEKTEHNLPLAAVTDSQWRRVEYGF